MKADTMARMESGEINDKDDGCMVMHVYACAFVNARSLRTSRESDKITLALLWSSALAVVVIVALCLLEGC